MFGTGPFAIPTFRALCASAHQMVALVTQPVRGQAAPGIESMRSVAGEHGITIIDPVDINSDEGQKLLEPLAAEMFVVADYGQILSAATLRLARLGAINLHGSLLPKYRGAAPINWAIYRGETRTGVTVIHMTPQLDAGPALAQAETPIGADETAPQLEARLAALGPPLVLKTIEDIAAGRAHPLPQNPAEATRARRLRKSDGAIDWSRSAQEIRNQMRAFEPWPRTHTHALRQGRPPLRVIVGRATVVDESSPPADRQSGEILQADAEGIVVCTGRGLLRLEQLQPAGKQMMSAAEFLRGYRTGPGDRFGSETDSGRS